MTEMIKACNKVGTPQHITAIQADIWTEQAGKILEDQHEEFPKTQSASSSSSMGWFH